MVNCEVCGKKMKDLSIFNGKRIVSINACSEKCLISFIKRMKKIDEKYKKYIDYLLPNLKFESELEEIFYDKISRYFSVEYSPYLLRLPNGKLYIPDFFLPEKGVFFEIKGVKERIAKAVEASKYICLFIITPQMMEEWGWNLKD